MEAKQLLSKVEQRSSRNVSWDSFPEGIDSGKQNFYSSIKNIVKNAVTKSIRSKPLQILSSSPIEDFDMQKQN